MISSHPTVMKQQSASRIHSLIDSQNVTESWKYSSQALFPKGSQALDTIQESEVNFCIQVLDLEDPVFQKIQKP